MLLKSAPSISKSRHPVIMPRPSSKCYIFEMETIKVICFSEKCFILNPEEKNTQVYRENLWGNPKLFLTQAFIRSLKAQFRLSATNFIRQDKNIFSCVRCVFWTKLSLSWQWILLHPTPSLSQRDIQHKTRDIYLLKTHFRINDDTTMRLLSQKSVQYQESLYKREIFRKIFFNFKIEFPGQFQNLSVSFKCKHWV